MASPPTTKHFDPSHSGPSAPNLDMLHSNDSVDSLLDNSMAALAVVPSPTHHSALVDQHYALMLLGPRLDFLSKLPYELAVYILHFVNMHDLTKVARISRTWNQFARDNEVWKNVYLVQQGWKIRLPSVPRPISPDPTLSPEQQQQHRLQVQQLTQENQQQQQQWLSRPLNWKLLCHGRKQLEEHWTRTPPRKTHLLGHADSVYCVQFDHTKIVTGSRDCTIKIWDLHTLKCLRTLTGGHTMSVLCLQFDDRIMVSGSSDTTIIVWDMVIYKPISRLRGHTAGVLDVSFDDQYIVSCSKDASIKVWDAKTLALVWTMTGHRGPVNAVQLHRGQVVSASGDGLVKLWNVGTGQWVRDFRGHERGLACVQFDGKTIVSGSNDQTIRVWDAATATCLKVLHGHKNLVRTLHFDQNLIVSGSYDNTVKVWDLTTGKCTLDLENGHSSWVFDVQFSASRII
ncbi:hypothetical protein BGW38_008485, partial [Lunasporangiospora selenospora]